MSDNSGDPEIKLYEDVI